MDPAIFVSDPSSFFAYYFLKVHLHNLLKIKSMNMLAKYLKQIQFANTVHLIFVLFSNARIELEFFYGILTFKTYEGFNILLLLSEMKSVH
jgi:hypothetical protein